MTGHGAPATGPQHVVGGERILRKLVDGTTYQSAVAPELAPWPQSFVDGTTYQSAAAPELDQSAVAPELAPELRGMLTFA